MRVLGITSEGDLEAAANCGAWRAAGTGERAPNGPRRAGGLMLQPLLQGAGHRIGSPVSEDLAIFKSACFVPPIRSATVTATSACSFLGVNFSGLVTTMVMGGAKRSDKALQVPVGKTPGSENESTNILGNQTS